MSKTTDTLSDRLNLGEALGGMIILAIVTNLPEIAIVISAGLQHKVGVAIGNILGGIAIQTVVLVLLDRFGIGKENSLTYKAASLVLILEGCLILAVLSLVVIGNQLPSSIIYFRLSPIDVLIFITWVVGLRLIGKARKDLPWMAKFEQGEKEQQEQSKKTDDKKAAPKGMGKTVTIFVLCAVITLVAGVLLEKSGDAIATHIGMQGILFGATFLAAATSLPEISTGLASLKIGDYQMAVSDIFGGNAFLPVLFLLATLLSGHAVIPMAKKTDIYLTGLGMILTSIYIWGLLFRPRKQIFYIGIDSFIVLLLYVLGIVGLFAIS